MSRIAWMLSGLLCLWGSLACAGVPETPRFRVVGVAEGMPSSSINVVARDRTGYLWLATPDGLARYDGVGFRIWRNVPGDVDSLPGNNVQALHVDAQDRIWIATEAGGLSVLDARRQHLRHYRMADDPRIGSDDTWAIASRAGTVWFGTYGGGLHRLDRDGRITRYMPDDADPRSLPADTVLTLAFDAQGSLWVGTTRGIARWTGKDFERIALPGKRPDPLAFSLTVDGDALWAGTSTGPWRRGGDGRWVAPSWAPMFEQPNAMMALARDRDGQFWIGSQRGLWRTRADGIPVPVHENGPGINKAVASLLLQPDGALWAPIPGIGLGYLRADWRQLAQFARSDDGLTGALYRGVTPALRGGVWLASNVGAPERLAADGSVEHLPPATIETLQATKFAAIVQDPRGVLWAGDRNVLVRIDGDGQVRRWQADDAVDPILPGVDILRIAPDGSLWLSSSGGGVQQRDASGKVLRSLPVDSHGLGSADLEAMAFAPDGGLWIAGDQGVARWHEGRDRFEPVAAMGDGRVYALAFDGTGNVWLSRITGLEQYRRADGAWRRSARAGPEVGIPGVEAAGMAIDREHRVWLSTTRGLFRWDPAIRHLHRFGVQDGLSSQEFEAHGITLTAAGVLAATTSDGGVVLVDTTAPDPAPVRPDLRIDQVAVRHDGRWQPLPDDTIELPPQLRELRVRTRLLAYADPLANRYASRLQGYDRDWVGQGASGERIFSGLQPGDYVLRLRASDAAGNRSQEQVLRWRVLPPWWRTPWALAGFAALVALLLWWAAAAYRERLKQRHALQLIEHERELAEQASLAKTRFLATLGHEVRTPMTGVLGMSELLLGTRLDERQRGYTESIRRAGNHLLRLVNDALDLARIEAGKLELEAQPFALRTLLADVVALQGPVAQQKELRFVQQVEAGVPANLLGDALRIKQVLLNLVGNAIKFTEHGEVGLAVTTMAAPGGVRFVVNDTGPGLNEEQKSRLFQRFEQAEGTRTTARYGGSGLGLAISQELAAAMGGRIEVDSTPGEGARFTLELPLPATDAVVAAASAPIAAQGATRARELLLVEDDPTVAEVIVGLLQAQGHRVVHAAHGLAALGAAAGAHFDLALLDLDLPGMDGLALARALRAQGFDAPLLAVTARADAGAEPQARAAGFDGFLRKPLTGAMLAEAVEQAVVSALSADA